MPGLLTEKWRATVPGHTYHRVLCDPASSSVFVSDGWGVPSAALRVHRFDIATGEHTAAARTRHQGVAGMTMLQDALLIATDSWFMALDRTTLAILRSWDKRVVASAHQLVAVGDLVVASNWLRPTIGVFDSNTGTTRRLKVGAQPLIFRFADRVHALCGYHGGVSVVDLERCRLVDTCSTPPISSVTAGRDVWGVCAGQPTGEQGQPPVWIRPGTSRIIRLFSSEREYDVGGRCEQIAADDSRAVVWCSVERGHRLVAVTADQGEMVATVDPGLRGPAQRFCHVDPLAGLAFLIDGRRSSEKGPIDSSTLVCYELPGVLP